MGSKKCTDFYGFIGGTLKCGDDCKYDKSECKKKSKCSISQVSESSSNGRADLSWDTDSPCKCQVEYGLTTRYGKQTTLDKVSQDSHDIRLASLQKGTVYHYRIRTVDEDGNVELSEDRTFVTR